MRLLIVTQKVDKSDSVLEFFLEWIKEFAKHFDKVTVICLLKGEHNLSHDIKVLSLGKEKGLSKLGYLFNLFKYIWRERGNYDAVFVHMNPRYVVYAGWLWRLLGKKISLWYAHGYVPFMLRLADLWTHIAFSSTKEGYRLSSRKLKIVGQGIDIEKFSPRANHGDRKEDIKNFRIVSIGRITPSKDYETLIYALEILRQLNHKIPEVKIIGGTMLKSDIDYKEELLDLIEKKKLNDAVELTGPIENKRIPAFLQSADLFVNMSHTGSLDKAILEAMACNLPVLTCNEALYNVFGKYADNLMYEKENFAELAEKIKYIMEMSKKERNDLGDNLREIVVREHSLSNLIKKISDILQR